MNHYEDHHDWVPSLPSATLSYHATTHLDNSHPHHPHHHHSGGHSQSSHAHTYPSQHVSAHANILNPEVSAPMLESPSFSQDRESHISNESVHDDDPHSSVPALPSYHLSHGHSGLSSIPPTPPQISGSFKRPFQPDMNTPGSSPQQSGPPNPPKRRKSSASKEAWTMTEDDNLLLKLKDDEGLPWKVIAQRFREMNRGEFRVPTLQMRYKRLKEKMRVWDADDIQYLKDAKEYVEKQKWELVSQRMLEIGCKKKIPGSTCEKKWKEIAPHYIPLSNQPQSAINSASSTPAMQSHEMKRELSQVSDELGDIREEEHEQQQQQQQQQQPRQLQHPPPLPHPSHQQPLHHQPPPPPPPPSHRRSP